MIFVVVFRHWSDHIIVRNCKSMQNNTTLPNWFECFAKQNKHPWSELGASARQAALKPAAAAALKPHQLNSLKLRECLSFQRTKYPFCIKDFLTDCSETLRGFLFLKMSVQNQEESMYSEDQLKLMQEVPAEMDFNTDVNFCNMETMVQADKLKNTSLTLPKPAAKTSPSSPNLGSTLCSLPSLSLDPSASTSPIPHPPSLAHPASNDVHYH